MYIIYIYIIFHPSFYVLQQFRISILMSSFQGLPWSLSSKESACQCRRPKRRVQSLGWEDPLEEGIATHSSFLAWRIPWTEEPGGL